jgi:uncharacterized repeat protein (TIGR01451 family)
MLPTVATPPKIAFAASRSATLDQWANLSPASWQNGNLNANNASYREGDSVPYRVTVSGLTVGQTYKVSIDYATTVSGKHAVDYLTTYSRTVAAADPCSGLTCGSPTSYLPIPIDSNVTISGVTQLPGQYFTLFGGTFLTMPTIFPSGTVGNLCTTYPCTINSNPSAYTLTGSYTGGSDTTTDVYMTANATTTVLAWGGHIATRLDWGNANSAANISGSPFHMVVQGFTCQDASNCSVGNQDRSLAAAAVILPGSITIVKHASTQGNTAYPFTASRAPLSNFSLIDNGTLSNTITFSNIVTFTTYQITETSSSNWSLSGIGCVVDAANGGSASTSDSTAAVTIASGENWTCTFTNTVNLAALSLVKAASPITYLQTADLISYTYYLTNTGSVTLQGPITVTDDQTNVTCPATNTLAPTAGIQCSAVYTVTQDDLDAGSVTNTAIAHASYSGSPVDSNQVQATVTASQLPGMKLTKTTHPAAYDASDQTITHTYHLSNTGNVTLHGPFTVTVNHGLVACPQTSVLAPGAAIHCSSTYTTTQADMDAGTITDTAVISGSFNGQSITDTYTLYTYKGYTLEVDSGGKGNGSVTIEPAGIDCQGTCSTGFSANTVVTLTATPITGSVFTGWGGACSGTSLCIVTLDDVKSVTANYALITYTLTVSPAGNGGGTLTSAPAGIDCGETCAAAFDYGTVVTLTAIPITGSTFIGWSGACTGIGDCVITISGTANVSAQFTLDQHHFTLNSGGSGDGSVSDDPSGALFDYGSIITVTATPSTGSYFAGWSGDASGSANPITLTIDSGKSVTATFSLYTYTVSVATSDNGNITSEPTGIDCGITCSVSLDYGTVITLTATPNTGWDFSGWQGACTNTSGPCIITVTGSVNVTPTFTLQQYDLTMNPDGSGAGSITSIPAGIDCGITCSATFGYGTVVTLTATYSTGSIFTGWAGACQGTVPCVVTITQATQVTATFTLEQYSLTVKKPGAGQGTVSSIPAGINCGLTCTNTFDYGTAVTLTQQPITGSAFAGWQGDCNGMGTCVVTIMANQMVTATYTLITTDLSISQSHTSSTSMITFTVVATNKGPSDANGSIISDTISSALSNPHWTCEAAHGASCPVTLLRVTPATADPHAIYETLPTFPNGGVVTYTISGNINLLSQRLTNSAEVIPPVGVADVVESDNAALAVTEYRVMFPVVVRGQ